jgi:hypothetical protein
VNSPNRRISRSRPSISGTVSRRAACCCRHPASIASNKAGSGRSGVASVTSTSAADPATLGDSATGTSSSCTKRIKTSTQRNQIGCHILASNPTEAMKPQVRPRVPLTRPQAGSTRHEQDRRQCTFADLAE